jgi:hypothetical protein
MLGIVVGGVAGLMVIGLLGVRSPDAAGPATQSQMTHESVVVTAIDRPSRTVTVQNADGETKTVKVSEEVKQFDALKVGDGVEIDYYETISVAVLPPGTKASMSEGSAIERSPEGQAGSAVREMKISGTVISVDTKNNKVTFKGPHGNLKTVTVSDPANQKKLTNLKPGQVVQLTYTKAVAAAIRPKTESPK